MDLLVKFDTVKAIPLTLNGSVTFKSVEEFFTEQWFSLNMPINLQFKLYKAQNIVHVSGVCDTEVGAICSRCAEEFSYHLHFEFTSLFKKFEVEATDLLSRYEDEDYFYNVIDNVIDLSIPFHEELVLNLPEYPLCSPDCKGICQYCGANLNHEVCTCGERVHINPIWEKLAKIKNNLK